MSLLSAGKQISQGDNSYGRGLFIADPGEAQRKARKQQKYQEELRLQMQEDKRRKQQQKLKEKEEDEKLQRKIREEMIKDNQKKPEKPEKNQNKNDKSYNSPSANQQPPPQEQLRVEIRERPRQEHPNYRFNFKVNTDMDTPEQNPYLPRNFNLIQAEQQRFFEENSNQKIKAMHEILQQKLSEVYKKIKFSQDLQIDKEIDIIRKKIASSNNTYQPQNYKQTELNGEISHFYKIPKTIESYGSSKPKNLNYESNTRMKRTNNFMNSDFKPITQQKLDVSRQIASRQSQFGENKRWGLKKGKNFLGDREAVDYQINNIMGKIDNLIDQQQNQ